MSKVHRCPRIDVGSFGKVCSFIEVPKAGASVYCGHIPSFWDFVFVFVAPAKVRYRRAVTRPFVRSSFHQQLTVGVL